MKTKILISAMALAFGSAAMAADTGTSARTDGDVKVENQLGDPNIDAQGPTGGPAPEAAKPNLQLGSEDVRNQGPEGGPAPEAAQPNFQLGSEDVQQQGQGEMAASDFSSLDKNNDGYISKDEADARVKDRWATADINADGKIDQSEFSALETTEDSGTMKHDNMGGQSGGMGESGRAMDKMEKPEN